MLPRADQRLYHAPIVFYTHMRPLTNPPSTPALIQHISQSIYSTLRINPLLTPAFTTPPTPNAGTIRPILASALTPQSLRTLAKRSPNPSRPCRLNRSSPSRWIGVLKSCMNAGARNCAVLSLAPSVLNTLEKEDWIAGGNRFRRGAIRLGRLKLAKMVRLSRAAKSA